MYIITEEIMLGNREKYWKEGMLLQYAVGSYVNFTTEKGMVEGKGYA